MYATDTIEPTLAALPQTTEIYAPDRDQLAAAARGLKVGNTALHFSALRDPAVAADVAGEPNMNELDITPAEIYGAAMNLRSDRVSECGVFTDRLGNTLVVCDTEAAVTKIAKEKKLFGPAFYETSILRYKGVGSGQANALITISGLQNEARGYVGPNAARKKSELLLPQGKIQYSNVFELFSQIEASNTKLDRPVVVVMTNDVITWKSLGDGLLTLVLAVAKPFCAMIGLPPAIFDVIAVSAQRIATTGRVTVADLASVAQTLAPESVRKYITQGANVYAAVTAGDYVAAADALGLSQVRDARLAIEKFSRGLTQDIEHLSALPITETLSIVRNAFNVQTTNTVRAQARSGSLIQRITDEGSVTRVPAMQDLLIASSAPTMLSALPNIQNVISAVINETDDVTNVHQHKAWLQAASGLPIGDDVFDGLLTRALTERAIAAARDGAQAYIMPISVPEDKRARIAQEVARQSGIRTLSTLGGHQDVPLYAAEWR